jgi:hypothetical protein
VLLVKEGVHSLPPLSSITRLNSNRLTGGGEVRFTRRQQFILPGGFVVLISARGRVDS